MTHNKSLTRAQQAKRDRLIARDCMPNLQSVESVETTEGSTEETLSTNIINYHKPAEVSRFLMKFSSDERLKYTTHIWDSSILPDYDDFVKQYQEVVLNDPIWKILYDCNKSLRYLIYNYLFFDGKSKKGKEKDNDNHYWSKYNLQVGLCYPPNIIKEWLEKNPGKQFFDMPLSEYKDDIFYQPNKESTTPLRIQGEIPVYFNEVVTAFKHAIEFRDSDLYTMVRRVFSLPDIKIDTKSLKALKGVSFYTDTQKVEYALKNIANNISNRKEKSTRVSIHMIDKPDCYELHIIHKDSFSMSSLGDKKLMLKTKGQMFYIKKSLQSLCDFYVISRFTDHETNSEVDARIDYLYTENADATPKITKLESGSSEGFEYVLRFYK